VELRHFRYFVAVAEELSFTNAARRLHTAQPSLSHQIRQLEEEVGTPLLARTNRRVRLTAAGRMFLRDAREILGKVEQAAQLAAKTGSGMGGELSIGMMPVAEVRILPTLLPLLASRLRDVRVVLHSLSYAEQLAGFQNCSIDAGFLWGPVKDPDLVTEEVLREEIVVALSAQHPLAKLKRIPVQKLESLPCVAISRPAAPALYDVVAAFYARVTGRVRTLQDADNVLGHLNMVRAGVGFALLPAYVRAIAPRGVVTRPLDWQPPLSVGVVLAHRKNDELPALDAFTTVLRAALDQPVAARDRRV
jgi:LysR family hca operon transcriptional activator